MTIQGRDTIVNAVNAAAWTIRDGRRIAARASLAARPANRQGCFSQTNQIGHRRGTATLIMSKPSPATRVPVGSFDDVVVITVTPCPAAPRLRASRITRES